jgi:hypothetical protein
MHAKAKHAALAAGILLVAGSGGALGVACANGGAPATSGPADASTVETGYPSHEASSGGSSGGGGCDANLATDYMNCGSCGHECEAGLICNVGQCQANCTSPQVLCPGEPGCFDLSSDMQNCGTCGTACLPPAGGTVVATAQCVTSQCLFTCPADAGVPDGAGGPIVQCETDSGGSPGCFDLTQTSDHCGACNKQCPTGQICSQSTCCPQGNQFCSSACVDVTKDPNNCGACDAGCPAPAQCSAGKCTGYTTTNPTGVTFLNACSMTGSATVLTNSGAWTHTNVIALPFSFTFYGTAETQFWLQSQGTLGIGTPQAFPPPDGFPDCTSGGDPTTAYPAAVAFGDSYLATGANGVCYATAGTAPNRQFVATWSQTTEQVDPGSTLTFSIVLTETTNTIDFMYQTMSGSDGGVDSYVGGSHATVGIQGKSGGNFVYTAYACAKSFITSTPLDVRFTPVQ